MVRVNIQWPVDQCTSGEWTVDQWTSATVDRYVYQHYSTCTSGQWTSGQCDSGQVGKLAQQYVYQSTVDSGPVDQWTGVTVDR